MWWLMRGLVLVVMLITSAAVYRIGWRTGAIEGQVYACHQFAGTMFPPQAGAQCIVEDNSVHILFKATGRKFFMNGMPIPLVY